MPDRYGLTIYTGGVRLLSTSEMGLAFDAQKVGNNISYMDAPNAFSQVEFPFAQPVGFWKTTAKEVAAQLDYVRTVNNIYAESAAHRNIIGNIFRSSSIQYANGHISTAAGKVLCLTNTIGDTSGMNAPVNPTVSPLNSFTYGFLAPGSLVDMAMAVDTYHLVNIETHQGVEISRDRAPLAHHSGFFASDLARSFIVCVPCMADEEVLAVCPREFNSGISVALLAQTASTCIYLCYSKADAPELTIYRYSKQLYRPLFSSYGLRVYKKHNVIGFSTENPLLLPLYVSGGEKIGTTHLAKYKTAVVFSRIDTLVAMTDFPDDRGGTLQHTSTAIVNGVQWETPYQLKKRLMGFAGSYGPSAWNKVYHTCLGSITEAWFERGFVDAAQYTWRAEFSEGLHSSIRRGEIPRQAVENTGAYLAVVAY